MRTVTYINNATAEKTVDLMTARTWADGYSTVLEDDHESAKRGRATRARIEALRAKGNKSEKWLIEHGDYHTLEEKIGEPEDFN